MNLRPGVQKMFTVGEVARVTSLSRHVVRREIDEGRLRAFPIPPEPKPGGAFQYCVYRDDLTEWMVRAGVPCGPLRRWLQPPGVGIIVAGASPAVVAELAAFEPVMVRSLFALGRAVQTHPAWACVLDLPALGREETLRDLGELAGDPDRPYLVGLVADDEAGRPGRAADVLDVLLPRIAPPRRVALALRRLRQFTDRGEPDGQGGPDATA